MATATAQAIIEQAPAPTILRQVEESAILAVWEHGKKHNIEFGRLCYEYGQKYGAQGSANSGLAQFLRKHSINEGVAYYWIGVHKASVGKGVPCPHCTDTFPSKTQLKKHQSKSHSESLRNPPQSETIQVLVAPSPITTPQTVTVTMVEPAPTPKIEAGQRIDNLFIHELFDNSAAYDGSRVWLVEDADSGEASLWRTCDLTRIERRGQHVNKCKYGAYDYYDGPITGSQWRMLCQLATERLADIKAGVPLDLGIHKDVLCRINEFDFNKELEAKKGTGWYAERFPTIFSQPVEPQVQEPVKQPSVKPIVVPNISTDSISNHTARLTEFWSHFNALNGVAKNIRTGVDKPTEASTLITLLQRISKDAAEKAVLIQNALDGVS